MEYETGIKMKTPEQWFEYWKANESITWPAVVKLAQADALRHAAEIAKQLNKTINANEAWHIMQALEAEADKLERK